MGAGEVKVQNNDLEGNIFKTVELFWSEAREYYSEPIIDFGEGPLGSVGNNDMGTLPPYTIYHQGPYDVYAKGNQWHAQGTDIDRGIWDKLDDPKLGRVKY